MALDFPNSPTLNQQYTHPTTGIIWVWDGAKWVSGTGATAYAPIASPVFTGNPQAPNPPAGDADTSVATTSFVSAAVGTTQGNVGRNLIHNSMFNVQQRGAGPWTTSVYTADRWRAGTVLDTVSFVVAPFNDEARAMIGDETAAQFLSNTFTGNAGASAQNYIDQCIEGVRRLSGKTVTVSLWVASSSPSLKLGANIYMHTGSGGSPTGAVWASATGVALPTTASYVRVSFTMTLPSLSGAVLGSNRDDSVILRLHYSSGATNNAVTGNIGVQSGTINIWGVQLEIGSVATPLEKPDPQVELANCQRFYATFAVITLCPVATSINGHAAYVAHPVTMHHTPTYVSQHVAGNVSLGITYNYQSTVGVWTSMAGTPVAGNYEVLSVTASADL